MTSSRLDEKRVRAARHQSLFREVNNRINGLAAASSATLSYVCECADLWCAETVFLSVDEYRRIRSDANCFFVVDGHELPDVEEVVERTDRYRAVRKLGAGARVAVEYGLRD